MAKIAQRRPRPNQNPQDQNLDHEDRPVSASDEDHALWRTREAAPTDIPNPVWTSQGYRPFYPAEPELTESEEYHEDDPQPDNPFNPKGQPSMHLPQQATPLRSRADGNIDPSNLPQTWSDPNDPIAIDPRATYVPYPGFTDNVANPRGTPDYLITGATPDYDGAGAGTPNTDTEPAGVAATAGGFPDNPKNPRGIPSKFTNGVPDTQAFDSQKAQNPTPARAAYANWALFETLAQGGSERVSAGQNRVPPTEVIP